MAKWKETCKRATQYIFHGVPVKTLKVNVAQVQYGGSLKFKRILITGGSRGLGFAIAKRCLEEKASVTITARTIQALEEAREKLGNPNRLFLLEHDVRDIQSDERIVKEASRLMGGLNCLINNAGISIHGIDYSNCTEEQWDRQMDTMLMILP